MPADTPRVASSVGPCRTCRTERLIVRIACVVSTLSVLALWFFAVTLVRFGIGWVLGDPRAHQPAPPGFVSFLTCLAAAGAGGLASSWAFLRLAAICWLRPVARGGGAAPCTAVDEEDRCVLWGLG